MRKPNQNAADFFRRNMEADVLPSNFILNGYNYVLKEEEFKQITSNNSLFLEWIGEKVAAVHLELFDNTLSSRISNRLLENRYVETFPDADTGAYGFALWFYHFDADNWFSFKAVREQTGKYLTFHGSFLNQLLEFRLIKGFDNNDILAKPITVLDLPVVISPIEKSICFWAGQLND